MKYDIEKLKGETLEQFISKLNSILIDDEFITRVENGGILFKSPHNMMHSKAGNKYSYGRLIKRGSVLLNMDGSKIGLRFKVELFFPILFGSVLTAVVSILIKRIFDWPLIPVILLIMLFFVLLMTYRIRNNIENIMNQIRSRT